MEQRLSEQASEQMRRNGCESGFQVDPVRKKLYYITSHGEREARNRSSA